MRARWAIFISGSGSNAHAILENLISWDVALMVSSRKSASGLLRAQRFGIERWVLPKNPDWDQLTDELKLRGINSLFLLGFMKIIPPHFCNQWKGQIWNLHPSLLPDFKGASAIEQSYEAGRKMGVTIHEVTPEMDAGPIVLQKKISDSADKDFLTLEDARREISQTEQQQVQKWMRRRPFFREATGSGLG